MLHPFLLLAVRRSRRVGETKENEDKAKVLRDKLMMLAWSRLPTGSGSFLFGMNSHEIWFALYCMGGVQKVRGGLDV